MCNLFHMHHKSNIWSNNKRKNIQRCYQLLLVITLISVLDSTDRQGRSASLSSDDVVGLSQSQQSLSRSSTLPYDHTPQRAQPQRGGGVRTKTRPSSPGSEMVTLEQFLEESNLQSPPVVRDDVDTVSLHGMMYCLGYNTETLKTQNMQYFLSHALKGMKIHASHVTKTHRRNAWLLQVLLAAQAFAVIGQQTFSTGGISKTKTNKK